MTVPPTAPHTETSAPPDPTLQDLLLRTCPNPTCLTPFHLPFPLPQGRQPIYCDDCRTARPSPTTRTRQRICPLPSCQRTFTLTAAQAAATTFCTPAHATTYKNFLKHHRPPTCHNVGCTTPTSPPDYYCCPQCAIEHLHHLADNDPTRLLCKRPACDNQILYDPESMARIQRFCSQDCRDGYIDATVTTTPPAPPSRRSNAATAQQSRRFKKVKLQGLETATPLHNPASRMPWQQLNPSLRRQYEKDGWTQHSWEHYPGPYSPAALHWAVLKEPQHVPLDHISVQDWASTLPRSSTTDFWNEHG